MSDEFLTTKQLADRVPGLSERSWERMRSDGSGPPFIRVSSGLRRGRVLYRWSAVERWLASREFTSTGEAMGYVDAALNDLPEAA